jgi:hypothetical protein
MADKAPQNSTDRRTFNTQFELLKMELELVNSAIRQLDDITKSIKNWSIVTWTASIGLAVSQQQLHAFVWLTAIVPFLFWFADSSFRRIHRSFIVRLRDIAEYVNSEPLAASAEAAAPIKFPLL